jgi:hypothetical protein
LKIACQLRQKPRWTIIILLMKTTWLLGPTTVAVGLMVGCVSEPPGAEHGPQGTIAYDVLVEASPPGARIFANGADIGNTPVHLKIFAKKDGRFHDFGAPYYVVQALPLATNQFAQARYFLAANGASRVDHVPQRIDFDMSRPPPPPVRPTRIYVYPGYPPPPLYYGPPVYYGPGVRFYYGPGYYRYW